MGVIYQPRLLHRVAMILEGGKNCAELKTVKFSIYEMTCIILLTFTVNSDKYLFFFFWLFFIYTVLFLRDIKRTVRSHHCGWHHQLDGHEFEQTPGVDDEQGSLACCSPWGCKESDTTK